MAISKNKEWRERYSFSKREFYIYLASFTIACTLLLFFRLDEPTVRMWDESRRAVAALEMSFNHDWLVPHFNNMPDMTGTKPPLLIWCIVLSMKIFGFNEFALRLPSALCALATVITIFSFVSFYFKNLTAGLLCGLTLITSSGFVGEHVARTGDFDAMLLLWVTAYSICFFIYSNTNSESGKFKCLLLITLFASLATLTKSIAGLLAMPGIFAYLVYRKKTKEILTSPKIYCLILIFLSIVSSYYLLREFKNPGYIHAVWNNELAGRYSQVLENHKGPVTFYIEQIRHKFIPWFYVFPFCLLFTQLSSNRNIKRFGVFSALYCFCYLLVVSLSETKLPWYDAQFYPIAAILVGLGLSEVWSLHKVRLRNIVNVKSRKVISFLIVCSLFILPYLNTFYITIYKQKGMLYSWSMPNNVELLYGEYLKHVTQSAPSLERFTVLSDAYNAHLLFYSKVLKLDGYSITLKASQEKLLANEIVLTCDPEKVDVIREKYRVELIDVAQSCQTFRIKN